MPFANPVMAGKFLVRQVMQSLNFLMGVSGWQITKSGGAEFNSITIRGGQVIGGGTFTYSGTPGVNTLLSSETAGTSDPFGNATIPGTAVYVFNGSFWSAIALAKNGSVPEFAFFAGGATQASPYVQITALGGSGAVSGGVAQWGAVEVFGGIYLPQLSGAAIPPAPGSGDLLYCDASNALNIVHGGLISQGGTAANPSVITTDTWHPMTLLNGWANVAGFTTARYRLLPTNEVAVIAAISAAAATASTFFTLPAGYQPATQQPVGGAGASGSVPAGLSPWCRCDTSGNLAVQNTGAVGAAWQFFVRGTVSLDA